MPCLSVRGLLYIEVSIPTPFIHFVIPFHFIPSGVKLSLTCLITGYGTAWGTGYGTGLSTGTATGFSTATGYGRGTATA